MALLFLGHTLFDLFPKSILTVCFQTSTAHNSLFAHKESPTLQTFSSPHEPWNRLHRTPPSFPTPPQWSKVGDSERSSSVTNHDRDKEDKRELSLTKDERDKERYAKSYCISTTYQKTVGYVKVCSVWLYFCIQWNLGL